MVNPLSNSDDDLFSCAPAGEAQTLKIKATVAEKKTLIADSKKNGQSLSTLPVKNYTLRFY